MSLTSLIVDYLKIFAIPLIILISFFTIVMILVIVQDKEKIKWYLMLKSQPDTRLGNTIGDIFEKNKGDKLIDNWTNYQIVLTSLRFQSIILMAGFIYPFVLFLLKNQNLNYGLIIAIILFIVEMFITIIFLKKRISLFFKIKEDLGLIKNALLYFVLTSLVTIPFWIVIVYLLYNKTEMDYNAIISIYLVLTLGMYEYIKHFVSFFFPTPKNDMCSTDELIKELLNALEGKQSIFKEIIDAPINPPPPHP